MSNKKKLAQFDFLYIPPVYFKCNQKNPFLRYLAVIREAVQNGFGKKVGFRGDHKSRVFEQNRGNVPHRVGSIISPEQHDFIVEQSHVNYTAYKKSTGHKKHR